MSEVSLLEEIFAKFAEDEVAIRNEYATKKSKVFSKYDCSNCSQRGECYYNDKIYEECKNREKEEYDNIENEEINKISDLYSEYMEKLEQLGFEVEFEGGDKDCFFITPPGYKYYYIYSIYKVNNKKTGKTYIARVDIEEYNKPWGETTYGIGSIEVWEE